MIGWAPDRTGPPDGQSADQAVAVPLQQALHTLSTLALATSGVALFGTPAVMLIASRDVVEPVDWLAVAVLAVAWLACLAIRPLPWRAAAQTAIGVVLIASPLLLGESSGGSWMPVTLVGFAVIVGAVFALASNAAIVTVLVVALVQATVLRVAPQAAAFTTSDPVFVFAGPLLTTIAGIGLVLSYADWRRQARSLDARQLDLEKAQEITELQVRVQQAQESVERRIHETVLNTLTGISMGDVRPELARQRAQRDLDELQLGIQPLSDTTVGGLIDIALVTSGADEMTHEVRIINDEAIVASIATALRDATVEALRNVRRHAQATHIRIEARVTDDIEVTIVDNGVGMSPQTLERFGLRSAIRRGMALVGGSVVVTSEAGEGTRVALTAPRIPEVPLVSAPPEASSLLDGSRGSRIGLLGTNGFLAIMALPIALAVPASPIVFSALIGFVIVNAVLTWTWTPRMRVVATPLAMACGVVALMVPILDARGSIGCSPADATPWLVAGISGGGSMLLLSAYRRLLSRLMVVVVIGSASVALSWAVGEECRGFTLLSAAVCIVYMMAIASFLTWIDLRFDATRRRRLQLWHDIVVSRAELASQQVASEQWNKLTAATKSLLEGLASGDLDPGDPAVQAEALTEGSALRARLGRGMGSPGPLASLLDELLPIAKSQRTAIEIEEINPWRRTDPFPGWFVAAMKALTGSARQGSVSLIVLHDEGWDELLIRCPRQCLEPFHRECPTQTQSYLISEESGDDATVAMVSIRRPTSDLAAESS